MSHSLNNTSCHAFQRVTSYFMHFVGRKFCFASNYVTLPFAIFWALTIPEAV